MKSSVAPKTRLKGRFVLTFIISACTLFVACKKEHDPPPPPDHVPPSEYYTRTILLKDMNVERLPSPYYHFEYDANGLAKRIGFASGLLVYDLSYEGRKLVKMTNVINHNTLDYTWADGKVTDIREKRMLGGPFWHYVFLYNSNSQVREIRYYQMSPGGNDSSLVRKVTLAYRLEGNLARYDDYRDFNNTGTLEWSHTEEYSNFDDGENVDEFNITKDFFDNVLFLPNFRFQLNNPRDVRFTSVLNDYNIHYDWTYNNKLPISKHTTFNQTRGNGAGQQIQGSTTYSYY